MTEKDMPGIKISGQMSDEAVRGFASLGAAIRTTGIYALAQVSPAWRKAAVSAAALSDFEVWATTVGIPESRARRVLGQVCSETGTATMEDRVREAKTRLLAGPPYDGTSRRFETMVEAWCGRYPGRSDGDARKALLILLDQGIFAPEAAKAMRESDRNDDE